jgi:hypothetical protein
LAKNVAKINHLKRSRPTDVELSERSGDVEMKRRHSNLKTWLRWSLATFLLLIVIHLGLPALFLALRVPSFMIGNDTWWLLEWKNTASESGIRFNLMPLFAIAIGVGLVGLLVKSRSKRLD